MKNSSKKLKGNLGEGERGEGFREWGEGVGEESGELEGNAPLVRCFLRVKFLKKNLGTEKRKKKKKKIIREFKNQNSPQKKHTTNFNFNSGKSPLFSHSLTLSKI